MSTQGRPRFVQVVVIQVDSAHATSGSIVHIGRGGGRCVDVLPLVRNGDMAPGRRRRLVQCRAFVVGPRMRRRGSLPVVAFEPPGMGGFQGPS